MLIYKNQNNILFKKDLKTLLPKIYQILKEYNKMLKIDCLTVISLKEMLNK